MLSEKEKLIHDIKAISDALLNLPKWSKSHPEYDELCRTAQVLTNELKKLHDMLKKHDP